MATSGPVFVLAPMIALLLGLGPTSEPQHSIDERITAPPPVGGLPSGGVPPSPRLAQPPRETSTRSRPADLELERLPDGTYRYVDPGKMFTMTVAPDGRAYFADRWRRPSSANAQHGKIGRRPGASSVIGRGAGFAMRGPAEFILQALGADLSTGAKMAALRRTEAFRTDLAVAWNRAQVRERLHDLPAELLALWHDDNITIERRREILFEHWDACEDRLGIIRGGLPADAVPEVDELRREAGEQARRTIEGFVRRELDEDAAFTAEELEAFNARRVSVAKFDPYTEPASVPPADMTPADTTATPEQPDSDVQPQD